VDGLSTATEVFVSKAKKSDLMESQENSTNPGIDIHIDANTVV
jgi:hypothetical protein